MLFYPVIKQLWLALCTLKFDLVSEWVSRTSRHFFIKEILNFGTAMLFQVFQLFMHSTANIFVFCTTFCRKFTLYITGKNVGKLTVIQTSTVPHNSGQVFCTPNCMLCGFCTFLVGELIIPEHSHQQELPTLY